MENNNHKEPAIMQLSMEMNKDIQVSMNKECTELFEYLKIGTTAIEPLLNKIAQHMTRRNENTAEAIKELEIMQNTLLNISIHFDKDTLFFIDYPTSTDDTLTQKYGADYQVIKARFLTNLGMIMEDFNNELVQLIGRNDTNLN